jgi:hypothetical protein
VPYAQISVHIYRRKLTDERGQATVFLPCDPLPRPVGRLSVTTIPVTELAMIVDPGSHKDIDEPTGLSALP